MKKNKIVSIEWEDASYNQGYWDVKDPENFNVIHNNTVGHLIKINKEVVITSTDRWRAPDDCHRHISTIPRKMIKKITYLKGE